ncbi:MAG: DNA polymerase, partial [Minisyncoccales bacterium]
VILSGDMDNLQLVSQNVKVYTMRRGVKDTVLYGSEEVKKRYDGLSAEQLIDFKALNGDPSDNIPGVQGVGQKTAIALLKKFGSLEKLYFEIEQGTEKTQKISPALLEKLKTQKEQAFLSQKLATMNKAVPLDFQLEELRFGLFNKEKVKELFKELEFESLLAVLDKEFQWLQGVAVPLETVSPKELKKQTLFKDNFGFTKEETIIYLQEKGLLSDFLADIEKKIIPLTRLMRERGIFLNCERIDALCRELSTDLLNIQAEIYSLAGEEFNINSPSQVAKILFEKMGLSAKGLKKTKGGAISTNMEELKKIIAAHPIVSKISQYRELFKLKSGFID